MIPPQIQTQPGTYISTLPTLDETTVRAAALQAASHAAGPSEARLFLAQLGLCGQALPPQDVPLACGHPSSEGVRRLARKGITCRVCEHERTHGTDRQEHAA